MYVLHSGIAVRFKALVLVAMIGISACAQQAGHQNFPQATSGFIPKSSYQVGFEPAWRSVVEALNNNSIAIANSSKDQHQITTEYLAGTAALYGLGIIAASQSRYKYNIFVLPKGAHQTTIKVNVVLENSMTGSGGGAGAFHDVSAENPQIVANLRNWLYEQIERSM